MKNVIKGVINTSLVDWPKKVVDTFFMGGCNYRCPTCHNKRIAFNPSEIDSLIDVLEIEKSINRYNSGWIDGVAISGGEPTINSSRLQAIASQLHASNVPICIHSNGTDSDFVSEYIDIVDLFCIDIKGPYRKYASLVGVDENIDAIKTRFDVFFRIAQKFPHKFLFRTTLVPELNLEDIAETRGLVPVNLQYKTQSYIIGD